MELNSELYSWLRVAGVIKSDAKSTSSGMLILSEEQSENFEYGLEFGLVIKRLTKIINKSDREATPVPELNTLKTVKSPAAKLYNWKVLSKALEKIGIGIDADSRSLIVAGDRQIVVEVLKQIYESEQKHLKDVPKIPLVKSPKSQTKPKPKKQQNRDSSFIEALDLEKSLEDCSSCLEFLLVSFCKNFELKVKQAAGLLTQNGKYLDYVLSKGLKGKHGPVLTWYQEVFRNCQKLASLISAEEVSKSVPLMLSSLRSGFSSKNIETAQWCCRVFSKLAAELINSDLLPPSWDWFVSENGGLESCLGALNRFKSEIASFIVNVLAQFGKNNFVELFTIQLRSHIPESTSYFSTMNELLKHFCEIKTAKQELQTSGIVEYWLDYGIRESQAESKYNDDSRLSALNFICDLWIAFPAVVENREEIGSEILNNLKKALRDKSLLLVFACVGKMFHLIENFSVERNTFAPVIYKSLTFYLVENYRATVVRELVLFNFCQIFDEVSGIPIGILLEPLVKQLQVANDITYATVDFEFFVKVAGHPRLSLKQAVQSMDVLGKIYLNDEVYSKAAVIPFMMIVNRFIQESSVQEYLLKLVKFGLGLADAFERNKRKGSGDNEELKMKAQKDAMVDLCALVVGVRAVPVNEKVIEMTCEIALVYKKDRKDCPGFVTSLLKLFGDHNEILLKYEKDKKASSEEIEEVKNKEKKETEESRKNLSRKRLEKGLNTGSAGSLNNRPNRGRIMLEIEKIRQNLVEKELEKKVKIEKEKSKAENRKRVLRKQLEKRRVELGIQSKIKDPKVEEKQEVYLILQELSAEDKELVSYVIKRYYRVLKLLFKKYSSTGYKNLRVGKVTFETAAEKNSTLSESEFYKLLKEQGVSQSMLSVEESNTLLKSFCHKQKKPQIKINFQEFQDMVVQAAIFIYSRSPKDLSHLSPAISVKTLFDFFRSARAGEGISAKFYDEPDPGVGDREIVKKLNSLLEKDPNMSLPEGYKKVIDNDIEIVNEVPACLGISENYCCALSALDMVLSKAIGIHLLEPIIKVKQVARARGVLVKPVPAAGRKYSESSKNERSVSGHVFQRNYQPLLTNELNLTSGIKFEVARLTGKYSNEILNETARLLDDIIHTVDSGCYFLISRNSKVKNLKKGQVKEKNSVPEKLNSEDQERKRKLRKQVIFKRMIEEKENKDLKKREEEEKKRIEQEKQIKAKERKKEKDLEYRKKMEEELKEWKKKKAEEDQEKSKIESEEKKKNKEIEKKKREQFLKAVQESSKINIEEKSSQKALDESRPNDLKKSDQLKETKKKQASFKIKKEKKNKEENDEKNKEFEALKNDPKIKQIFVDYEKSLQVVFSHFCKAVPGKEGSNQTDLSFPGFNKFCTVFNVVPGLFPNDQCLKLFNSVIKAKKQSGIVLTNEEFAECLLNISFSHKSEIEKVTGKQLSSNGESLEGLFEYFRVTTDAKKTRDLIKDLDSNYKNSQLKENKKIDLTISISREITPPKDRKNGAKTDRDISDMAESEINGSRNGENKGLGNEENLSFLLKSGLSD